MIKADIPALLGLSALDLHSMTPDTVVNGLIKRVILDPADGGSHMQSIAGMYHSNGTEDMCMHILVS